MEIRTAVEYARQRHDVSNIWRGVLTPLGHILSIIVEELEIEKPNLNEMISNINKFIPNKYSKLIDGNDDRIFYGSSSDLAISSFLDEFAKPRVNNLRYSALCQKINDEIIGIIPEDRIFEKLNPAGLRKY